MSVPLRGHVRLALGDARHLDSVPDRTVALVVTSPPYPMIPQWDGLFRALGASDYPGMLRVLADAWRECRRVLEPGGILAVNIGDALRSVDGEFRLWPNAAETTVAAARAGFTPLPYVLWKKPTNKPNAFLGSGFLPPNAYVTLDCEFVLLFRNGPLRRFAPHDPRRAESRYARTERDAWFSQIWADVRGARQDRGAGRTGAFPPELPERLVRMFSVVGDTVLDPFAGTGTTLWAAARWGRNAIGVECDPAVFRALVATARAEGYSPPRRPPAPRPPTRARRSGARPPRRRRSEGSAVRSR
ncbi:MAG TPA: site-specific DNA-methyltransferase [Thermoplasmata archaeon]|nr:site-specific DNA-methyltransferase [Thermoplasmata archaeon]